MSTEPSTSTLRPNFVSIFNAALETYKYKTNKDLALRPPLPNLQSCDSHEGILTERGDLLSKDCEDLTVPREQIPTFSQSQNCRDDFTKWVIPTANVLYSFFGAVG